MTTSYEELIAAAVAAAAKPRPGRKIKEVFDEVPAR